MLKVDISVVDYKGKNTIVTIRAVRGDEHKKIKNAFYYDWRANVDHKLFTGRVLHSYDNGAVSLTQKLTKQIVAQQKALKEAKR
jgi:hypothetical protein